MIGSVFIKEIILRIAILKSLAKREGLEILCCIGAIDRNKGRDALRAIFFDLCVVWKIWSVMKSAETKNLAPTQGIDLRERKSI